MRVATLQKLAASVPQVVEAACSETFASNDGRGGDAAAAFRGFECISAFSREGSAGGLVGVDAEGRGGWGWKDEGGYTKEQRTFVSLGGRGLGFF